MIHVEHQGWGNAPPANSNLVDTRFPQVTHRAGCRKAFHRISRNQHETTNVDHFQPFLSIAEHIYTHNVYILGT